jgi:hypothetical protein
MKHYFLWSRTLILNGRLTQRLETLNKASIGDPKDKLDAYIYYWCMVRDYLCLILMPLLITSCIRTVNYDSAVMHTKEDSAYDTQTYGIGLYEISRLHSSDFKTHRKLRTTGAYVCIEPYPDLVCLETCHEELSGEQGDFKYLLMQFKSGGELEWRNFSSPRGDVFKRPDFFGKAVKSVANGSERYTSDGDIILREAIFFDHFSNRTYFKIERSRLLHDGQVLYSSDLPRKRTCRHDPGIEFLPDLSIQKPLP